LETTTQQGHDENIIPIKAQKSLTPIEKVIFSAMTFPDPVCMSYENPIRVRIVKIDPS